MSAHPTSAPALPAWLDVPSDPNDLVSGVWPTDAERDAAGELVVGGVMASDLVRDYGTPLYVLDESEVRSHALRAREAFASAAARHGVGARVYYAGKAFLSTEVVRWVTDAGLAVDVASGGELAVALAAGADPARIGVHGNNKSVAELESAVAAGVGSIVVDSFQEIDRLAAVAAAAGVEQPVLLRVNSGVHAETHDFLATAHEDQKFGFTLADAIVAAGRVREAAGLLLIGLHCHIGSQIFGTAGFAESAARIVALYADLLADPDAAGDLRVLNLGGGFGIAYTRADSPTAIEVLADGIVDAVAAECAARGVRMPNVAFEPGRVIVGQAGPRSPSPSTPSVSGST